MTYYPAFLDLRDKPCVVVGGGTVAEEKVEGLERAGARITVIAPRLTGGLSRRAQRGEIDHRDRDYRPGDLEGAYLVIAERIDPLSTQRLHREAERRRIPINVQDDVEHCSFIAPSIVRRGALTVAISTGGRAPALAVRLRQHLETVLGPEYGSFLDLARCLRGPVAEQIPDFDERRKRWYRLVDSDVLHLLRENRHEEARNLATEIMGVSLAGDDESTAAVTAESVP